MPFLIQAKTNWKFIGIAVVLVVIVGAGIFVWQQRMSKEKVDVPKEKAPEGIVIDKTSDWKTYKNEEYGFEVDYPAPWISEEFIGNPDQFFGISFQEKEGFEKSVSILIFTYNKTVEDFIEGAEQVTTLKQLSINNYPAVLLGPEGAMGGSLNIFKNGYRFVVDCHYTAFEEWEEMLSTFRFIGPEKILIEGYVLSSITCEEWLKECTEEGEGRCSPCGCRECCGGLVSRQSLHPYRNTATNEMVCLENMAAYVCVRCGDGVCGKGEDWCICPEDCDKPNPQDLIPTNRF